MSAVDPTLRVAAVLFAFTALGFGIPCIYGIRSLLAGQGVPLLFGFPSYGGGVFEQRFGIQSTPALLLAFMIVCAMELVAATLLWNGQTRGALLGLALLPFGLVFWVGFSLPIPPLIAVVRTTLLLVRWDKLL